MGEDDAEITMRGPQARGELWCKGANVMKGRVGTHRLAPTSLTLGRYWKNPTATAETLTSDGWLKTGDIAYVDDDGKFFIVDRKKELIKVKANQVAPAELEALLLEHQAVADAAVVGVLTPEGDEKPRAYVVLQPQLSGSPTSLAKEIADYVRERVAPFKRLTGGVVFIDAVPKNPSGKILRRQLRDQARREAQSTTARI